MAKYHQIRNDNDWNSLERNLGNSGEKTEKPILNWIIGQEYESLENEISITVGTKLLVVPQIELPTVVFEYNSIVCC